MLRGGKRYRITETEQRDRRETLKANEQGEECQWAAEFRLSTRSGEPKWIFHCPKMDHSPL
jgi:hypothetical protein